MTEGFTETIYEGGEGAGEPLVFAAEGGENFPFAKQRENKCGFAAFARARPAPRKFKKPLPSSADTSPL